MKYEQRITLKNGNEAWLRNGDAPDGNAVFDIFDFIHEDTANPQTYPYGNTFDPQQVAPFFE